MRVYNTQQMESVVGIQRMLPRFFFSHRIEQSTQYYMCLLVIYNAYEMNVYNT